MDSRDRTPSLWLIHGSAGALSAIADGSVQLIVTSPPYPMIPQWDATFLAQGAADYDAMHDLLEGAWREAFRVLVPGAVLAVVVGDALRSNDGGFRLWPNHSEVLSRATRCGFVPLPYVLWKKPTNKPTAFLGSGFLPPNAYVTIDCEFVLLFRRGGLRRFPPHDAARYASRFSRPERDRWFSQIWGDIRGTAQVRDGRRTGAFPAEIPRRLVRMFSVKGDTVLDPFAGTGTTVWTALALGRSAIGVERDDATYARLQAEAARRGLTEEPGGSPEEDSPSAPRTTSGRRSLR